MDNEPSGFAGDAGYDEAGSVKVAESESEAAVHCLQGPIKRLQQHVKKVGLILSLVLLHIFRDYLMLLKL